MSIINLHNINNEDEFIFDSDKIQITTKAKLKPIVSGAEAYSYWKLDETTGLVARDTSGNERDGSLEGTFDENSWVTSGKFNNGIEGDNNGFIKFDPYGDFERTQAFSISMWIQFTDSATQLILSKQLNSGAFQGYIVNMVAGKLRFVVRDINGNRNTIETLSVYTSTGLHLLTATYDGLSDVSGMKLYIDNVEVSTIIDDNPMDSTIKSAADLQISGRDGSNSPMRVGTVVNDVQVYERELTPAEIAFLWNDGDGIQQIAGATTSFATDNPTLTPKQKLRGISISDFIATVIETGSDEIRLVMEVSGTNLYWNGSAWVESSGFTQSNTIAEINTNISTLLTEVDDFRPIFFLHSDDGSSTPEISDFQFTFSYQGEGLPADLINECKVFWYSSDSEGEVCTQEIKVELSIDYARYKNTVSICKQVLSAIPDSLTGFIEFDLVENENMLTPDGGRVTYKVSKNGKVFAEIFVPDQDTAILWEITI